MSKTQVFKAVTCEQPKCGFDEVPITKNQSTMLQMQKMHMRKMKHLQCRNQWKYLKALMLFKLQVAWRMDKLRVQLHQNQLFQMMESDRQKNHALLVELEYSDKNFGAPHDDFLKHVVIKIQKNENVLMTMLSLKECTQQHMTLSLWLLYLPYMLSPQLNCKRRSNFHQRNHNYYNLSSLNSLEFQKQSLTFCKRMGKRQLHNPLFHAN